MDLQRRRLLDAMADLVGEEGYAAATVTAICARAGLSRQTFYQRFDGRETCFLAVLDRAYGQGGALIIKAFSSSANWQDGLREAFATLLALFESRPGLARVWMIESMTAGSWALAHRERLVLDLTEAIVEYWDALPAVSGRSDSLVASTVMAAVVGAIQRHLLTVPEKPLIELLGPLMEIATGPFLDPPGIAAEVRRGKEIARQIAADECRPIRAPERDFLSSMPPRLLDPRAHRARAVLCYLASHQGASNRELAKGIGVASDAQMSDLLNRLGDMEMIHKQAGAPGHANSCTLTAKGKWAAKALARMAGEDLTHLPDSLTLTVNS